MVPCDNDTEEVVVHQSDIDNAEDFEQMKNKLLLQYSTFDREKRDGFHEVLHLDIKRLLRGQERLSVLLNEEEDNTYIEGIIEAASRTHKLFVSVLSIIKQYDEEHPIVEPIEEHDEAKVDDVRESISELDIQDS